MNQNESELRQIHRYIRFPSCRFVGSFRHSEEVAISRWAAIEIAKAITKRPDIPANETIGEFYSQMIQCMLLSKNEKQKHLFKVAADAAAEIAAMI